MKWLKFAITCAFVVATATYTAVRFGGIEARQLRVEIDRLEQERRRLVEYAERLGSSRRVAQVDVVRQRVNDQGQTVSTLLWQEIGGDGLLGRPLALEAVGELVYFEALVLKFQRDLVGEGDPERGVSLAMFRRIFGDCQVPDEVAELDRVLMPPGQHETGTRISHIELWERFWDFVDDPRLAGEFGVRVAQCEAPAVPLQAGQIWELSLDASGGLNLRKIGVNQGGYSASGLP